LTNQTNPVISIGGTDVVSYRYQLDGSDFSEEIPVSTNIDFSADLYVYGQLFTAGSTSTQEMLDDRADFIENVTFDNVTVDTPVVFLLNKIRMTLQNDNVLSVEGSNIDQLEVFMNNSPDVPAVVVDQSLTTNPQHITYALHTDSPQTDYIRIINHSAGTASFTMNLNNKLFATDNDVMAEIQSMTPEYVGEPIERKVWRFIRDNRYHWSLLSEWWWPTASPALFFNSIGFGLCGNSAMVYCQLMTLLGYQTRLWWLDGHVVAEVLINGRWELYDPDEQVYYENYHGEVAGVEELAANPALITNPINPLPGAISQAYSQYLADIYATANNNLVEPWYYDYSVSGYVLNLQIPAGGTLEFPAVFAPPIHTDDYTDAPSYTNGSLTVPRGWNGTLDTPLVIHTIGYEGPHTLSVIAKDSAGNWQVTPTVASWTTDSWAPVTAPSQTDITYPVTLTANEPATIYYTLNGSTPTTGSPVYSGPIDMGSSPVLKFFAVDLAMNYEQIKCYSPATGETYLCTPVSPATGVTITADKPSPQVVGTVVTFTAVATGGTGNYEYYFTYLNPKTLTWTVAQGYSSLSNWRWNTAGMDTGIYSVQVSARSAGSTTQFETLAGLSYTVNPPPATGLTYTVDKSSPQNQGTVITFTASASGGSGSYDYSFKLQNPVTGQWSTAQAYSSNAVWVWNTTGITGGAYNIQILAKSAGSSVAYDVIQSTAYTIVIPPATGVTLTPDKPSPQIVGSVVSFTGSATGGTGNYEYYFPYRNPQTGLWYVGQAYSSNPVWVFNTAGIATGTYYIQVWTRSAGSTAPYDVYTQIAYTVDLLSYAVTSSVSSGSGTIFCVPATVLSGGSVVCSLSPADGFYLESLTDNLADVTSSVSNNSYTFSNVTSDHAISATFGSYPVKKTPGSSSSYYFTIHSAYDASSGGDLIQAQAGDLTENLLFDLDIAVTLSGGYQSDFSAQSGFTTIHGSLTINSGTLIVENLIIE
jgi:hypothetical protein